VTFPEALLDIPPKRFAGWMRKLRIEGDCLVWPHGQPIVRVGNKVHRLRSVLRVLFNTDPSEITPCNRKGCANWRHGHDYPDS